MKSWRGNWLIPQVLSWKKHKIKYIAWDHRSCQGSSWSWQHQLPPPRFWQLKSSTNKGCLTSAAVITLKGFGCPQQPFLSQQGSFCSFLNCLIFFTPEICKFPFPAPLRATNAKRCWIMQWSIKAEILFSHSRI